MNSVDCVNATMVSLREIYAGMDKGIYQRKNETFQLYQEKDTGVLYPSPISDDREFQEVFFEYHRNPDRVVVNWDKSSGLIDSENEYTVRVIERIFSKAVRSQVNSSGEDECYLDVLSLRVLTRSNVKKIMKQVMATTREFIRIEGFSAEPASPCSNDIASPWESPRNYHTDSELGYSADTEGFRALNSSSASAAEGR